MCRVIQKISSHHYDQQYYFKSDGIDFFQDRVVSPKIEKALKLAQVREGMTVLDVGCGRGDFIFAALRKKVRLVGIDYSQVAMKMSSSLLKELPGDKREQIALILSDGTELPLSPQSVDAIFLMDLVEHLYPEQLRRCFKECKRVLKEEGRLVIHTSPNRWYNDIGYPLWERPLNRLINYFFRQRLLDRPIRTETDHTVHVNEQTVFALRRELKQCGFRSKVWFGLEYLIPVRKKRIFVQLFEVARQMVCHLYPLSLVYPLKAFFSNDIWAIAKK